MIERKSILIQNKQPEENKNKQTKLNRTSIMFLEVTHLNAKHNVRAQKKQK